MCTALNNELSISIHVKKNVVYEHEGQCQKSEVWYLNASLGHTSTLSMKQL